MFGNLPWQDLTFGAFMGFIILLFLLVVVIRAAASKTKAIASKNPELTKEVAKKATEFLISKFRK